MKPVTERKLPAIELARAMEGAGVGQAELGRRVGTSSRNVRYWLDRGVPDVWAGRVIAAIALRPSIKLTRQERIRVAELLNMIVDLEGDVPGSVSPRERNDAARYRDKIRASVGGYIASE